MYMVLIINNDENQFQDFSIFLHNFLCVKITRKFVFSLSSFNIDFISYEVQDTYKQTSYEAISSNFPQVEPLIVLKL